MHPLLHLKQVQDQIRDLIYTLLLQSKIGYIQGIDCICTTFFLTFIGSKKQLQLVVPMVHQVYTTYLKPFVRKDKNLDFKYAALLMQRLTAFYLPKLHAHFTQIGFLHDYYLVQWFVALFAHTLPLKLVQTIWTYLFT